MAQCFRVYMQAPDLETECDERTRLSRETAQAVAERWDASEPLSVRTADLENEWNERKDSSREAA